MLSKSVIVSSLRTPVGKSGRGTLRHARPDDLAAAVLAEAVKRAGLAPADVEDIVLGCAFPEAEQGMNLAQIVAHRAGFPPGICGQTVNRFCSSGLQAIATAANAIETGQARVVAAGGAESMSCLDMGGNHYRPNPWIVQNYPQSYVSMGITAENVAAKYNVSRADQDAFALRSHQRALAALSSGAFADELVPVPIPGTDKLFTADEGARADTSLERLATLKPVFKVKGTVTAGNSSQTSDGAAMSLLVHEDFAKERGLQPLGRLIAFAVAGVPPELMGIGPIAAIPKVLQQAGLKLSDLGLIELNEAFASQSLAIARELGLDQDRLNVHGGAIALGHPLGCTGAKLTATLLHTLKKRGIRYGMVTMCIGGGMGAAGIFENLSL